MAGKKVAAEKPLEFPKSILVKVVCAGTDDECLIIGPTPADFTGDDSESVKTARYVLAGTGTIQHSAPTYIEDAKA